MFFTQANATTEPKLKERLQLWGRRSSSGISPSSSTESDNSQDQLAVYTKLSEAVSTSRQSTPTCELEKVNAPSREAFLYLGAISFNKQSDDTMSTNPLSAPSRPVTTEQRKKTFGMFLQTTKDGFSPLDCEGNADAGESNNDHKKDVLSPPAINNSSILAVRYNASQSRSMRDHKLQWYRSRVPMETPASNGRNVQTIGKTGSYWTVIHGATRAVYQPSVTDCGYYLKCVVIVEENSDDEEHHPAQRTSSSHECTLRPCIELDPMILSQAQKCFQSNNNCASFDHLLGCGKAEGKILRIIIEQGHPKYGLDVESKNPTMMASNIFIYQVSGNTEIALHDVNIPIYHATAEADASRPNIFYLLLPVDLPESAVGIQSLCTNQRLELYAEDRVTRETFMTALGIANFNGSLSSLSVKTPLFRPLSVSMDLPPIMPTPRPQRSGSTHDASLIIADQTLPSTFSMELSSQNSLDSFQREREPPSPLAHASSMDMNKEASHVQLRIDALERSLKQKDCDLVQSEKTIEAERLRCEQLREALNTAEQRIE